jgi:integrase/recombinase XerD
VAELIKACQFTRQAETKFRQSFKMRRPSAFRDEAIILTLLDTGLRASELCALTLADLDLKAGKLQVRHGVMGGAKGGKGRQVYIGKITRKAIWRYISSRGTVVNPDAPLFICQLGFPFNKDSLRQLLGRIGKRANIHKVFPHKFRHTFAITYLRSGGDVFTLQALLGHSSLDMVRHYAQIAQIDVEKAHQKASPADNWRLG